MAETDTFRATRLSRRRAGAAAGWGVLATVAMTAVMGAAMATGASPLPKPIPAALVGHTLGPLPQPALLGLALAAHLAYGGLTAVVRRITVVAGLLWGGALWLAAGLVWLPWLGWGLFGTDRAAAIAVGTLGLHLVYGAVLGWLAGRARLT